MDKLERFEKALSDILNEYDNIRKELEKLRNEGKSKTTKFRELLGKKLVYSMIITNKIYCTANTCHANHRDESASKSFPPK